jgi:hypothetical protein
MARESFHVPQGRRRLASFAVALVAGTFVLSGIAEAQRGGGKRAGASGQMAHSSVSGANRNMQRPPAGGYANTGAVNAGRANTGAVNTGRVNTGNVNTGNVNRGNVNTGNINTGNVNIGNDVNINIDGGYGYGGYHPYHPYHPVAAGAVIGAMAVTTAAVVGSYYRALPANCTIVMKGAMTYHYCGSVYYQQTWSGDDVVYVVVNP